MRVPALRFGNDRRRRIGRGVPGRCDWGFSLVEVMIGMTLLGMVLGSCLIALPEIRALAYRSDDLEMGYTELNSEFENLRTRTFAQLAATIAAQGATDSDAAALLGVASSASIAHTQSTVARNGVSYEVNRYLAYDDDDSAVILALAQVNWTISGRPQSVSGRVVFTENGLSDKKFSVAN